VHLPGVNLNMDARGYNGQVHFDGQFVTITRQGFIARARIGKGDKRIPLTAITAVQWKPATWAVRGFIQFTLAGGVEVRSRFGRQTADAGRDENTVVFSVGQMPAFAELRTAIEAALARTHGQAAAPVPRTDPAERLQELARLHAAGLINDRELEAKRAEVLRQI
jgi:hypothetical protein